MMESRPAILTVAILGILLSLVFTLSELSNEPVTRDEAIAYTGEFVRYEVWRNGRIIHFADGTTQEVYPHTEPASLARRMETLERGTVLHLLFIFKTAEMQTKPCISAVFKFIKYCLDSIITN